MVVRCPTFEPATFSNKGRHILKKFIYIVFALFICVVMTSCDANDRNDLFETPDGKPIDTTIALAEASVSTESSEYSNTNTYDVSVMFEMGYQYGNMQKNLPPGGYMRLDNKVLFQPIAINNFRLYSYDLSTGEVQSYCKDATCVHRSCSAGAIFTNLEIYHGKIYGMNSNNELVVIDGGAAEIMEEVGSVSSFIHHNDRLYVRTSDSSLIVLEKGSSAPNIILEEYVGFWHVIFGDYLYANTSDNIIRVNITANKPKSEIVIYNAGGITDGQHIYYIDFKTDCLYRCNLDGTDPHLLVGEPVLESSMNFDDEYFYFRYYSGMPLYEGDKCHDIYRFPKNDPSQIEKIATLEEAAYQVFTVPGTGKIFVETIAAEGIARPTYVMNTDGSEVTRLKIPEY